MTANRLQKYNYYSENGNSNGITCYILAKINAESLKLLSNAGLNIDDWRHVPMVEQFQHMLTMDFKREIIYSMLSEEYGISVSSVKRVIRRMLKQVKM